MAAEEFALENDGPKRLRVTRRDGDRYAVALDGVVLREVARVPRVPQSITLPDGSELVVEWRQGAFNAGEGWHIARNGAPLPGTVADPARVVREAALAFFVVATLTGIGAALALAGVGFIRSLGVSGWGLVDAAVLAACGWGVLRRSRVALIVGIVLFVAGSLYGFSVAIQAGGGSQAGLTGAALVRVALLFAMARAVPVLWKRGA